MKGMLRTLFTVLSAGTLAMNVLAILMFAVLSDLSEVDWTHFIASTIVSAIVLALIVKDVSKDDDPKV